MKFTIGLDYGTDSCRALIVNITTGEEVATAVKHYKRWKQGRYCNSQLNQYRQHPLDYVEALEEVVKEALAQVTKDVVDNIIGIAFDTTGSTPVLTDKAGTPLALLPEFKENPNAMFVLWKDHTAIKEAEEINALARKWEVDFTKYEGGIYSSEWVWAKMLHILRNDKEVRKVAYSWIEHCDWMTALLTGNTIPEKLYRSRCAAGHKAMWHEDWNGFPPDEFFTKLDPLLSDFRDRLDKNTYTCDVKAGYLTQEWANRLGLTTKVAVGVSALDCHMGAIGAQIKPGVFVRVMGTSTCDIMITTYDELSGKLIPGICGQVDGSVVPGMIGLEAGQSAFGDLYAWWCKLLEWPLVQFVEELELTEEKKQKFLEKASSNMIIKLTKEAEKLSSTDSSVLATDWMNGRRTPDANQLLKGTIGGLILGTTAPMVFKALVEATAYGSKAIMDRFIENGIEINEVIAIGGISQKSSFVMQILSDVTNRSIKVAKTEQACALGAAMFAAVAAGEYSDIALAQDAMGKGFMHEYKPNAAQHKEYSVLYNKYRELGTSSEQLLL